MRGYLVSVTTWLVLSLAGTSSALAQGLCTNLLTPSWAPPQPAFEHSLGELMEHLNEGSVFLEGSVKKIKSGVHTWQAFESVIASHGLREEGITWKRFEPHLQRQAEMRQPQRSVQVEVVGSGVIRAQLGEQFWVHAAAMSNARVSVGPGQALMGIKTLFPLHMTQDEIRTLAQEVYAALYKELSWEDLVAESNSQVLCFESEQPRVPPMRVKMVISRGRPVTFFPMWDQSGCEN